MSLFYYCYDITIRYAIDFAFSAYAAAISLARDMPAVGYLSRRAAGSRYYYALLLIR